MMFQTAFVLGAGLGKRLRPLTEKLPKPLLPIGGRPLITIIFEQLIALGAQRIVINTHHLAEKYTEHFPEKKWGNVPLIFEHEEILLDTGGGLKNIARHWTDPHPLLIHNGDIYTTLDISRLLRSHDDLRVKNNVISTLALRSRESPRHVRWSSQTELISHICPKTPPEDGQLDSLYTGICVVEKKLLDFIPPEQAIGLVPIWNEALSQGHKIGASLCDDGTWEDIGTLDAYARLNNRLASEKIV